jgi:type II secretory pathway component HofQ
MIEARIVEASDDFFKNLGVRFGFRTWRRRAAPQGSRGNLGAELGQHRPGGRAAPVVTGTPSSPATACKSICPPSA